MPAADAQPPDNSPAAAPMAAAQEPAAMVGAAPDAAADKTVRAPVQSAAIGAAPADRVLEETGASGSAPSAAKPESGKADSGKRESVNPSAKKRVRVAAKRQAAAPRRVRRARASTVATAADYYGYAQTAYQSIYDFSSTAQSKTVRVRRSAKTAAKTAGRTARNSGTRSATP